MERKIFFRKTIATHVHLTVLTGEREAFEPSRGLKTDAGSDGGRGRCVYIERAMRSSILDPRSDAARRRRRDSRAAASREREPTARWVEAVVRTTTLTALVPILWTKTNIEEALEVPLIYRNIRYFKNAPLLREY